MQVVQSILTAIPNRPLEMVLSLMRGVIAKVTNVFPKLAAQQLKKIQQQGLKRQQKIRQRQSNTSK